MTTEATFTSVGGGADLRELLPSFVLSLRAGNKAPRTIEVYTDSLRQLTEYLISVGAPTDVSRITREHVELFESALLDAGRKASTVSVRHRALQAFWKWATEEREVAASPMANMAAPIVPEVPVRVPTQADLRRLLDATAGNSFEKMRDRALLMLLIDTGLRASEAIDMRKEDVELHGIRPHARVIGKGRRIREVPVGAKAAKALDKYLRARRRHPHADLDWLWLSSKGHLTTSGLRQLLERRCDQAGIERIHPHALRHHFAHAWMMAAGAENELMAVTGWRSRAMLSRYAASTVSERAAETHRRISPGDSLL